MKAYLHFGTGSEPRLTVAAPCEERRLEWQKAGLARTASGYGRHIATPYVVKHEGRWRRVYSTCYGNAASTYIGTPRNWLATVDVAQEG